MTDIQKGIPDINLDKNSHFKDGRKAASDIADAGPGHHTQVDFPIDGDPKDIASFQGGCQYICAQHPGLKVARRTHKTEGVVSIYVVYYETEESAQ